MSDAWLSKRRQKGYDCADFAAEALGVPVEAISGVLSARKTWRWSDVPREGVLTLMRQNGRSPHVGIYSGGGVWHLGARMVMFQPLHMLKREYNKISFYAKRNCNN